MIIGFRHSGLERLYRTGSTRGVQVADVAKLIRILAAQDAAAGPADLNLPSYRLHELKGDRKGVWSICVSGNWRITFRFAGTDVELIDYEDYH
ncbi:MAG TPA: type II toxin-antitoxin system RelE/ParE family toxin [Methylocystis sp.]|nr:type II toxin-antitoxin system RelE/ParE family toxin [Methylocystis sp.]